MYALILHGSAGYCSRDTDISCMGLRPVSVGIKDSYKASSKQLCPLETIKIPAVKGLRRLAEPKVVQAFLGPSLLARSVSLAAESILGRARNGLRSIRMESSEDVEYMVFLDEVK